MDIVARSGGIVGSFVVFKALLKRLIETKSLFSESSTFDCPSTNSLCAYSDMHGCIRRDSKLPLAGVFMKNLLVS